MLPKKNRLKTKKDINLVFRQGKGVSDGFLFLKTKQNNLKESRFGFVVGKNFSKKAVVRNKIKRKIREAVRKNLTNIQKGIDGIFIIQANFGKEAFVGNIEKNVLAILDKSKILKNKQ